MSQSSEFKKVEAYEVKGNRGRVYLFFYLTPNRFSPVVHAVKVNNPSCHVANG